MTPSPDSTLPNFTAGDADEPVSSPSIADDEFIDDVDDDPTAPIQAPLETPIADALDQRRVVVLDDAEHERD